jgi:hypothetical protein
MTRNIHTLALDDDGICKISSSVFSFIVDKAILKKCSGSQTMDFKKRQGR